MASLKSSLEKHRTYFARSLRDPHTLDAALRERQHVDLTLQALLDRDTLCVNAQSVWDDLVGEPNLTELDFTRIPRPMPPYRRMWLEHHYAETGQRCGVLTRRDQGTGVIQDLLPKLQLLDDAERLRLQEANPAAAVWGSCITELGGLLLLEGEFFYCLDGEGAVLDGVRVNYHKIDGDARFNNAGENRLALRVGWVMHTFARLNCRNVKLVAMPNGGKQREGKTKHPPSTVWNTIQVSAAPITRNTARSKSPEGEGSRVRFHWVRGHYADYSKGPGLFGNPKLRGQWWIPEHKVGDEELGTVVADYEVK